jgi:hypothetical protein
MLLIHPSLHPLDERHEIADLALQRQQPLLLSGLILGMK